MPLEMYEWRRFAKALHDANHSSDVEMITQLIPWTPQAVVLSSYAINLEKFTSWRHDQMSGRSAKLKMYNGVFFEMEADAMLFFLSFNNENDDDSN